MRSGCEVNKCYRLALSVAVLDKIVPIVWHSYLLLHVMEVCGTVYFALLLLPKLTPSVVGRHVEVIFG